MERPDCELCGVSFEERNELEEHMEQHLGDAIPENKLFDCRNCRRSFFSFDDIDNHNRRVHTPYN